METALLILIISNSGKIVEYLCMFRHYKSFITEEKWILVIIINLISVEPSGCVTISVLKQFTLVGPEQANLCNVMRALLVLNIPPNASTICQHNAEACTLIDGA